MFTPILVALTAVLAPNSDLDADAVVRKWVEGNKNVHAVHATFVNFQYDLVFGNPNKPTIHSGEVYFNSPTDGFWYSTPKEMDERSKKLATRLIWKDNLVTIVNDEKKQYHRGPADALILFMPSLPRVDVYSPFLPGLPDKTVTANWQFTVADDSEDQVMLEALPQKTLSQKARAKQFQSCRLLLRKPDMTLHAVEYVDLGGKSRSVFVFDNVEHNPENVPQFDLSEYSKSEVSFDQSYLVSSPEEKQKIERQLGYWMAGSLAVGIVAGYFLF